MPRSSPSDWKNDPRVVPRVVLAVPLVGLLVGAVCGLLEWGFHPQNVTPGDPLAAHVAWRSLGAGLAATVGGLVVYPFIRPLTPARAIHLFCPIQIFLIGHDYSRQSFPWEPLFFGVSLGLAYGVILRVVLNLTPPPDGPGEIRRRRS